MSEYSDLGQYIMKLFDSLITESKQKMNDTQEEFIRDLGRKYSARNSITLMSAEGLLKELFEQIYRINQDVINQYSISIAKQVRNVSKKRIEALETEFVQLKEWVEKHKGELDGYQAQIRSYENRTKILEKEKETTLEQYAQMTNMVQNLQAKLSKVQEECQNQINLLNTEWEKKFKENQDEWESYVKLKIAEQEIQSTSENTREADESG
ncbi:MAG: hypothetical protein EAX86_01570 [Candidatus Heimdallarchaeota archaeon]|nr:hypothetical protein [Candidatus Heimdallarchaeota archaeon]